MKKQLTEKTVYQPNARVKVTVTNKPILTEEGKVDRYDVGVAISYNAGTYKDKLSFGTDDDIARFIENMDVEDPQQSLLSEEEK